MEGIHWTGTELEHKIENLTENLTKAHKSPWPWPWGQGWYLFERVYWDDATGQIWKESIEY